MILAGRGQWRRTLGPDDRWILDPTDRSAPLTYKVLVQQGAAAHFELVEAPDIRTAEQATGGIVVSLVAVD